MSKSLVYQGLREATAMLVGVSSSPALDARLLMSKVLNLSVSRLLALEEEASLTASQIEQFQFLLEKRLAGYPVAYLLGYKEFYGYTFKVGEGVLIPRADSEIMVETLLEYNRLQPITSLRDIGTGPGTLAISLFLQLGYPVTASDISPQAQHYFNLNNEELTGGKVAFLQANLLEDGTCYDVIVANLPYLTTEETEDRLENGSWQEPSLALDGGEDGLDLIRILIEQSKGKCRLLLLEADPRQMDTIGLLMEQAGYQDIKTYKDLAGDDRIIVANSGFDY